MTLVSPSSSRTKWTARKRNSPTSSSPTVTLTMPAPKPLARKLSTTFTTKVMAGTATLAAISKVTFGISALSTRGRFKNSGAAFLVELFFARGVIEELHSDSALAVSSEPVHVRHSAREAPVRDLSCHQLFGHVQADFDLFLLFKFRVRRKIDSPNGNVHRFDHMLLLRPSPQTSHPHGHTHDEAARMTPFLGHSLTPR